MTRVRGRKKIIWVPFGTQQVSCDWQSSSQNCSSRSNPSSRVSFAAQAVLMTCLTAACWSLESALTRRAVNREMRESIEIKPSLFWQPRWKGVQRLWRGGEEGLEGGEFNCMWGPSQRWQSLINKHWGLQKQTYVLNSKTRSQESQQSEWSPGLGLQTLCCDCNCYRSTQCSILGRLTHWEDQAMLSLQIPLPPGILFICPSSKSKGISVSQCIF